MGNKNSKTQENMSAASQHEQRARGLMEAEDKVFKHVQKDHISAVKKLEKLTLKQKKINKEADAKTATYEKGVKKYETQLDKDHKKIIELQNKQQAAVKNQSAAEAKLAREISKQEDKRQKAQTKLQSAVAKKEPIKNLYKYQQAVDSIDREIAALQRKKEMLPDLTNLEVRSHDVKIMDLNNHTQMKLGWYKHELAKTAYNRDRKLAELESDVVRAQLAVQQYEKHLATKRSDLVKAQNQVVDAAAVSQREQQERLEQERLEQERLENERLENERAEQERLAHAEEERQAQERAAQETQHVGEHGHEEGATHSDAVEHEGHHGEGHDGGAGHSEGHHVGEGHDTLPEAPPAPEEPHVQ